VFALPFESLFDPFAPLFDPAFGPSAYGLTDVADVAVEDATVPACAGIEPKARLTPINPANEAAASRADAEDLEGTAHLSVSIDLSENRFIVLFVILLMP
jgi:hypothetical protein